MDFDKGAVEGNSLYFEVQNLLALEALKYSVENATFAPPVHPRINAVPTAEMLRKPAPFAPVLRYIKNGIQYLKVTLPLCRGKPLAILSYCSRLISIPTFYTLSP